MTNFDKITSMSLEELAEWIDNNGLVDNTPWQEWWDKTYCQQCDTIKVTADEAEEVLGFTPLITDTNFECAYCEIHDECKFFMNQDINKSKTIIKLWLEADTDEDVI